VDATIFLFLLQDGIINGAVYALVAIATVLVFAVTRVILVPQGEFVAFTALTIAALENGRVPSTPWLLLALGGLAALSEVVRHFRELSVRRVARIALFDLVLPVALLWLTRTLAPMRLGQAADILLAIALITPMGPMIYRIAFEPIADSSVLVLLMAAFGVHFSLTGLGLLFFGPEGTGTTPLSAASFSLGNPRHIRTKRRGAGRHGRAAGAVRAVLWPHPARQGAAGVLVEPRRRPTGRNSDLRRRTNRVRTGRAARCRLRRAGRPADDGVLRQRISDRAEGLRRGDPGRTASYPLTVLAALGVGFAEALFSFWASNFKEVLVFTLIIPVLAWRSVYAPHAEETE